MCYSESHHSLARVGSRQVKSRNARRSDRVSLSVPIQVSGTEAGGDFAEKARTLSISRHGATIVLNQKLAPAQQIIIQRMGTNKQANARVVGQIGGQPQGYVYGIAFLNPNVDLWDIEFPALTEPDKAVARVLLECVTCQTREVAHLNELEAEVFEANRCLTRSCKTCNGWTSWRLGFHERAGEAVPPPAQPRAVAAAAPPAPAPRTENRRKHNRIVMKVMACVRQPGFGEEIVRVENVSRGGLNFVSSNTYFEGSRIEVAVPYTPGGANIFVAARIAWSCELPDKKLKSYGVTYI